MKTASLVKNGMVIVDKVEMAVRAHQRMKGLLGRTGLERGEGMWLSPCGSVHTLFMKFNLDVVFVDRRMQVVNIVRNVKPFKTVVGGKGAYSALEVQSGWLTDDILKTGDSVFLIDW